MGVSRADVDSVEWDMQALLRELDGKSNSTFPGDDEEQQRFLAVVRAWATVAWGEKTFGQAAQKMTAMLPALREVCALPCANLWYTQKIHSIRGQIVRICGGYEQAVAEQAAREKAEEEQAARAKAAAAARAGVEAEAKAARRTRVVEARASVTRETRRWGALKRQEPVMLTAEQSEAVRAVVEAMEKHVYALESLVTDLSREKLWYIDKAVAYLDSCSGDGTWIWNAEAWEAASGDLTDGINWWHDYTTMSAVFWEACAACMRDMQAYKEMCQGDARPWYRRMLGVQAKLDALRDLAEG